MGVENVLRKLAGAEVAGVRGDSARTACAGNARRLRRSCRGQGQTSAPASTATASTCDGHAEVAGVSDSFTHAPAHARARAREQRVDTGPLQTPQPLHVPGAVTLLKHCRCMDCRRFHEDIHGEFFCESYIGGTRVEWATGKRYCDPPADAWHYCADYHGPQISKDVWAWPRRVRAEVAGVGPGPSDGASEDNPGGNGRAARLFRSPARTQGTEASQP